MSVTTVTPVNTGVSNASLLDPRTYDGITWFRFFHFSHMLLTFHLFVFPSIIFFSGNLIFHSFNCSLFSPHGLYYCLRNITISRPDDIGNTVSGGVPAWGQGQFNKSIACGLWFLTFVGVSGMHRFYLGDYCMAIACFLTGGFCCIGECIDLCSLSSKVENMNAQIRNLAQSNMGNRQGPTVVVVQQAQPQLQQMQPVQDFKDPAPSNVSYPAAPSQ